MFLSLCYVVLRRVLQLAVLRFRSNDLKELEIGSLDNFTHCALGSAERADATDAGANVTAGKKRRMARLV